MKYHILLVCFLFVYLQSFAQTDSNTSDYYFCKFEVTIKHMPKHIFCGISQNDILLPAKGKDLTSYMDEVYKSLDCCFDEWTGVSRMPEIIVPASSRYDVQCKYSGLFKDSKSIQIKLGDGCKVSVKKYLVNARLYKDADVSYSTIYPTWYFENHPMKWYVLYDISDVRPCFIRKVAYFK